MTGYDPQDPDLRLVVVPDESEECARRRSRLQALRERIAAGRSGVKPAISSDLAEAEEDKLSGSSSRPETAALFDVSGQDVGDAGR